MTERQAVAREEVALPLVEVEDLSKIFDVSPPLLNRLLQGQGRALLTAVDHVSFRIPRGTPSSLVGESGCGTSPVARLVVRSEERRVWQVGGMRCELRWVP